MPLRFRHHSCKHPIVDCIAFRLVLVPRLQSISESAIDFGYLLGLPLADAGLRELPVYFTGHFLISYQDSHAFRRFRCDQFLDPACQPLGFLFLHEALDCFRGDLDLLVVYVHAIDTRDGRLA